MWVTVRASMYECTYVCIFIYLRSSALTETTRLAPARLAFIKQSAIKTNAVKLTYKKIIRTYSHKYTNVSTYIYFVFGYCPAENGKCVKAKRARESLCLFCAAGRRGESAAKISCECQCKQSLPLLRWRSAQRSLTHASKASFALTIPI